MRTIAFACDRCKKVIQEEGSVFYLALFAEGGEVTEEEISAVHFCKDCTPSVLSEFLTKDEKKEAKEEESKDAVKRRCKDNKRIDTGKVLALRKAGWSDEEIASDMNLSEEEIRGCY